MNNSAGGEIGIFVGSNGISGPPSARGLLQFDVASGVPAGVTITDATLTLYLEMTNNGTARTVDLRSLNVDWGEGSAGNGMLNGSGFGAGTGDATWNANKFNESTWTTPGGDFSLVSSGSASISGTIVGSPFTWNSSSLANDVKDWYQNPSNNHGWILISGAEGTSQSVKTFYSKEFSDAAVRPKLTVTYVPEPGSAILALLTGMMLTVCRRLNR